jgi:hypothetical protein
MKKEVREEKGDTKKDERRTDAHVSRLCTENGIVPKLNSVVSSLF